MSKFVKRLAVVASASLTTLAILWGTGGAPAAASWAGEVGLCIGGNYAAYLRFPQRGGWTSPLITNGCWSTTMGSSGNFVTAETFEVRGVWNTHPDQSFLVCSVYVSPGVGTALVMTNGTTTQPKCLAGIG
ncbi:hypothetical protein [Catellatospora citrea]|uniref:Secreted protein n=1 Tax=Catellatospora citrea TaxID=53366 RepID=A0A8J3KI02_9ACTN|nr:hypothetical protein [Catellatospora citrea]RKE10646.1 hypothetical protein C8E86_5562 [Catellatospora citrea]GIG03278.1 hypothetical protein Cci01nite_83710 [Catellatospora citrea]